MGKLNLRITLNNFLILGMAAFCLLDFASAAGIYKLDYPQGYGCCCPPNVANFGYFRTGWREWPGEVRLDKTFPRAVGMEKLPTPQGQEIIPVPKTQLPVVPTQPQPGLEGETGMLPSEGLPMEELPSEKPAESGQEAPALPSLPTTEQQGEFNPLPGLPSDLNVLPPLKTNEQEDKKAPVDEAQPGNGSSGESEKKDKEDISLPDTKTKSEDGSNLKSPVNSSRYSKRDSPIFVDTKMGTVPVQQSLPTSKPKADWESALQPDYYDKSIRSATSYSNYSTVQEATHVESVEGAKSSGRTRDIALQLFQQPAGITGASGVVQSEYVSEAPRVALDGFCPVQLIHGGTWAPGDPRWTVVYKGLIYRFSGNSQRQEFLANPEKFIPVNNGFDPVLSTFEKQNVPGLVNFCASYKGRIYMFSSAATQEEFYKYPDLYSGVEVK